MAFRKFDRDKLHVMKLSERRNQIIIETSAVSVSAMALSLKKEDKELIRKTADRIG